MTAYGTETAIAYPTLNIKVETVNSFTAEQLRSSFQRITEINKVRTLEDENRVLTDFSAMLQKLKRADRLLYKHADPTMLPTIVIKYPKNDDDGSWLLVTTYTVVVL